MRPVIMQSVTFIKQLHAWSIMLSLACHPMVQAEGTLAAAQAEEAAAARELQVTPCWW